MNFRFRMFDTPESANLWFNVSNGILVIGAVAVAVRNLWADIYAAYKKEKFSDERIAANEAGTKRAVADSDIAKESAAKANETAARLNNEAPRLQADNLALQTVLRPRHAGLIGIDEEPRAKTWFAGFEFWADIKVLIQVVPGDPEARNLANEIAIILAKFGWHPEIISEVRSGISLNLHEGLTVFSPGSYKAWNPDDPAQHTFARLNQARVALAHAPTQAGLGLGSYPVPSAIIVIDFPPDSDAVKSEYGRFDAPLDGVYLQVGSRPIGATMAWIRNGRPDSLGNKAAAVPELSERK
jgi:hypothetical protein